MSKLDAMSEIGILLAYFALKFCLVQEQNLSLERLKKLVLLQIQC